MNWHEALEEICSVGFDVSLNVVSGTNNYFRAVARHPVVKEAYQRMVESGELQEDALGRIYTLANAEVDPHFENPNDTPLAVLLWLTKFAAPDTVRLAATYVDQAPHCWYAKKLARRILSPPPSSTANHISPHESHQVKMTGSTKNAKLPKPLILDAPRTLHRGNSQTKSSVLVTTWSSPSEVVEVGRGSEF